METGEEQYPDEIYIFQLAVLQPRYAEFLRAFRVEQVVGEPRVGEVYALDRFVAGAELPFDPSGDNLWIVPSLRYTGSEVHCRAKPVEFDEFVMHWCPEPPPATRGTHIALRLTICYMSTLG